MSKKEVFESWYNDIDDMRDKGILQVKNGLEYEISLTTNKKPELKKQKSTQFATMRKKYEVTGVFLHDIKIANQKEIDKIITKYPTEESNYEQIKQLQKETRYTLKLTEQQYNSLLLFMQNNAISLKEEFYFRRFGTTLNTYFKFYPKSQIIKKPKR